MTQKESRAADATGKSSIAHHSPYLNSGKRQYHFNTRGKSNSFDSIA